MAIYAFIFVCMLLYEGYLRVLSLGYCKGCAVNAYILGPRNVAGPWSFMISMYEIRKYRTGFHVFELDGEQYQQIFVSITLCLKYSHMLL